MKILIYIYLFENYSNEPEVFLLYYTGCFNLINVKLSADNPKFNIDSQYLPDVNLLNRIKDAICLDQHKYKKQYTFR